MINLATLASIVAPILLVLVVDRVSLRLTARQRRDATAVAVAVAAEPQAQSLAAMPAAQGPRVVGPELATGDARSVA